MRFPEPADAEHDFGSIEIQQRTPERISVLLEHSLRFPKSGQRIAELVLLSEGDPCKHDRLCLFERPGIGLLGERAQVARVGCCVDRGHQEFSGRGN